MKNTSKILAVLMLVALMVAVLATYSFAAAIGTGAIKTGQNMKFSDYSNVNFLVHDSFEGGDVGKTGTNLPRGNASGVTGILQVLNDGKGAPYIYDTDSTVKSSKSYVKLDYTKNTGTIYTEPMFNELAKVQDNPSQTPYNGFIMEFDLCSQATSNNDWSCKINLMNTHSASGGSLGIFRFYGNQGKAKIEGIENIGSSKPFVTASAAGGWVHVTIIYNPAEEVISVYANESKVDRTGSVSRTCITQISNVTGGITVYPMGIRVDGQSNTKGDLCIDNVLFYQGTMACDPQYMDRITPAESFVGNVSLAKDGNLPSPQRYAAYEKVRSEYINIYWTGTAYTAAANTTALKQAVTDFNGINGESLKTLAMTYNVNQLEEKVKTLKNLKRGFSNLEKRQAQISTIETFMTSTATLIDKDNAKYATAIGDLDTWKLYYQDDISIRAFINRMNRFGTATTAAAMQRHYDEATEFYPAASAVESKIGSSDTSTYADATERTNIRNAISAYKNAGTKLAAKVKDYNAQKFINLVSFFEGTTSTEWEADDGTIKNQWYLARGILLENNYNASYSGFSSAKTGIYDPVNTYFSAKMQAEHVAVLQAKLAVFEAESSNYVDKAGVCKYIDNYLERNAADIVTDADINAIKAKNAEYKTLLASLEIDYTEKLVENTAEFVSQMEHIATVKDYKDLKPLFDEATVNYYNMNLIGNEGAGLDTVTVQNAVSAYEALKTRLLNNEVYGARFVAQMADLPSEKSKDDYYAAFMNCYGCEEYLDVTYEGVADCKGRYDTMKANYLAKVELANTESASTLDSVCSVRTFCGIGDLINHVQKTLFGGR
ncbi:MAG: hypothetical protein IJF38_02620 [Clostridia bacterium]|nr:hypothetical protein [Clostridia bacterium]